MRPPSSANSLAMDIEGKPVLRGKIDDVIPLVEKHRARQHDKGISTISGHRGESAVELVGPAHLYDLKLNGQRPCRSVRRLQHVSRRALAKSAGMQKRSDAGRVGKSLLEQA